MRGSTLWVIQRVSALIMCAAWLILLWVNLPLHDAEGWRNVLFFSYSGWIIATAFLMMYVHAVIGMYVVSTDYVQNAFLQSLLRIVAALYVVWGCGGMVLWLY